MQSHERLTPKAEAMMLSSEQVADMLCIGVRTLWRLVASRKVPQPRRFNRKLVRWNRQEVLDFIATGALKDFDILAHVRKTR